MELKRCAWALASQHYTDYHDTEWGVPVHDDRKLFEMLILEGVQAGLSWALIPGTACGPCDCEKQAENPGHDSERPCVS